MRNKMIIIIGIIVVLFGALFFVNNAKNEKKLNEAGDGAGNPYGTKNLKQETIDLLDDPLYQNIIVPEDLDKKLADKEDVTVYYFSPTCVYCQQTTPQLMPIVEELDIDMKKMNLLEFDKMEHYGIEGTPSLVHYEAGEEVGRIVGLPDEPEETYRAFFDKHLDKQ